MSAPSTLGFGDSGAMRSSFFNRIHMNRASQPTSDERDNDTTSRQPEGKSSDQSAPKINRLQKLMHAQRKVMEVENSPKSAILPPGLGLHRNVSSISVQKHSRLASSKGRPISKIKSMMPDLLMSFETDRPPILQPQYQNSVN